MSNLLGTFSRGKSCNNGNCQSQDSDESAEQSKLKLQVCSACRSVYYCSRDCQKSVWKSHKASCLQLQKALTATVMPGYSAADSIPRVPAPAAAPFNKIPLQKGEGKGSTWKKQTKVLQDGLELDARQTYEFIMRVLPMQVNLSDKFDRIVRGLPPRDDTSVFTTSVDAVINASTEENCELYWNPIALTFKSWMYRATKAGYDFTVYSDIILCIADIRQGLQLLLGWEPRREDNWCFHYGAIYIITTMCSGIANQKCFIDRMLSETGDLRVYIQVLQRWVDWKGPGDHFWNEQMLVMLGGLMVGLELSEQVYHMHITPASIACIEPIGGRAIQHLATSHVFVPFVPDPSLSNPQDILHDFQRKHGFVIFAKMCLRLQERFPRLSLRSLTPIASLYKQDAVKFFKRYPMLFPMSAQFLTAYDETLFI